MKRKRPMTWRRFEYTMNIPRSLKWNTELAQQFADSYADSIGGKRRPIVFDLAAKGRGSRYLGMFCEDRIRLSLELDTDGRWRTLIHELAHHWAHHGQKKLFLEAMEFTYETFRNWVQNLVNRAT